MLKKFLINSFLITTAAVSLPTIANAASYGSSSGFYIGVQGELSKFKFDDGFASGDSYSLTGTASEVQVDGASLTGYLDATVAKDASSAEDPVYFSEDYKAGKVFVGMKVSDMFSIQGNYTISMKETLGQSIPAGSAVMLGTGTDAVAAENRDTEASYSSFGLTAMVHYALSEDLNIFALGGIDYMTYKGYVEYSGGTEKTKFDFEETGLNYRVGGGVSFMITEQMSVSGKYEYIFANGIDLVKSYYNLAASVQFSF